LHAASGDDYQPSEGVKGSAWWGAARTVKRDRFRGRLSLV
jgi:hypothetical protein